ncbi:MAG: hypothetical protein EXS25_05475 [Pedosphaera sp.]|nr:hypothetical protein [Pedosphaera sp.]
MIFLFSGPLLALLCFASVASIADVLPGTTPLTWEGDPAARIVGSIDASLDRVLSTVVLDRTARWPRDVSTLDAFSKARDPQRRRLKEILGIVDGRDPVELRHSAVIGSSANGAELARGAKHRAFAVRWTVFRSVEGEGLLLDPEGSPKADVVLIPDCEGSPEALAGLQTGGESVQAFGARLANAGCRVIIPVLLNRGTINGGNPGYRPMNHSQRETLWRASYEMGRTPGGYDIQKALAAADWLVAHRAPDQSNRPLAIAGTGEGGRVALHAAALDDRFSVALVSGYFQPREAQWLEPLDRNVWSYVRDFGDAEIASLLLPRTLLIEDGAHPSGIWTDANSGAPGKLSRPTATSVTAELDRARAMIPSVWKDRIRAHEASPTLALGDGAFRGLAGALQLSPEQATDKPSTLTGPLPDGAARQLRQYRQLLDDTQALMVRSSDARQAFWKDAKKTNLAAFTNSTGALRDYFKKETVGVIPPASVPSAPQTRLLYETNGIRGYEVALSVHEGLPAYGILVIPAGMKKGERRPVVVCQHGLEGRPTDLSDPKIDHWAYHTYGYRLAEQGYVTFAPQNAYIGNTRFRQVLRKAQPLGLTLWSFIIRQHEVITDWLADQPYVDPQRIAFYGLSYGGKSAMRIPVWVDRYCLSICSADYNEWIWKCTSTTSPYSYLFNNEYDMPEWNLGNTFNYAELSWLICPRPFMVERGHDDGVAPDEWVAYEYAKTRRLFVKLGIADRTEIEFFNGPHTINGVGTFAFLRRHLSMPPK